MISAFGVDHGHISKSKAQKALRSRALLNQEMKGVRGESTRATRYATARNEVSRMGKWRLASPRATDNYVARQKGAMRSATRGRGR